MNDAKERGRLDAIRGAVNPPRGEWDRHAYELARQDELDRIEEACRRQAAIEQDEKNPKAEEGK